MTAIADESTAPSPTTPSPTASIEAGLMLTVTSIINATNDIRTITLARPDGAPLPGFVPGSHLVVDAGGRSNAYSLISDGTSPTEYTISVLHVADGRGGSRWLHEQLAVGQMIRVLPPRSAFAPAARARKHLLIAGGIGITPVISHLRAAARWQREVQVLYTFRERHGAHIDDLTAFAGSAAELFTARADFSRRLTEVLTGQPIGTHLYVCGPAGLIDHVLETAGNCGWPKSRLHCERFGTDALDPGDPFTVHVRDRDVTIDVPSGTSLLEALEDNGFAIPNLCRQGVCGECRIDLCGGGEPVHRDLFLTDDEKNAGAAIMPCVSRAAAGATLEVSL